MTERLILPEFVEGYPRPEFDPLSFEYGHAVVTIAANALRKRVEGLAASADPSVAVQIKTDPHGATSPVTIYDQDTERLIGAFYIGTGAKVEGEEQTSSWPDGKVPKIYHHVDPIDGTGLFVTYLEELFAWMQLPEHDRPPRPICGSMVSDGVARHVGSAPISGSIAAPFMPNGIIRWSASPHTPAVRVEPDGERHLLMHAKKLPAPKTGGVVLVASDSAERTFRPPLEDAGFKVKKLKSAVAAALCVMDPGLFERIMQEELGEDSIVAVAMRSAKAWDLAATAAMAKKLGHSITDIHGNPWSTGAESIGAVLAVRRTIGRTIVRTLAPHI